MLLVRERLMIVVSAGWSVGMADLKIRAGLGSREQDLLYELLISLETSDSVPGVNWPKG